MTLNGISSISVRPSVVYGRGRVVRRLRQRGVGEGWFQFFAGLSATSAVHLRPDVDGEDEDRLSVVVEVRQLRHKVAIH